MPQAICVNCGAALQPGAGACSSCGRGVDGTGGAAPSPPAHAASPIAPPTTPVGPASAKGTPRPIPVSSLVILGLGIALIVIAVLLVSRKPTPPAGQVLGAIQTATRSIPAQSPAVPAAATPVAIQALGVPPVSAEPMPIRQSPVPLPAARVAVPVAPTPTPPIEKVYVCRKGAEFKIDPDKAIVYVDGEKLGKAEDWNGRGDDKTYRFEKPGAHYAKFVREGYRTGWVKITVRTDADTKIAEVELKLHKHGEKQED